MIDLYTWTTPNGYKISIMLEEIGLPYNVIPVNLSAEHQFKAEFTALNPNQKIPAIVDNDLPGGPLTIFESGAILIYLAEKTGQLLPTEVRTRSSAMQWLMFQKSAIGPILGQTGHFVNTAPEKIPYAIQRFTGESLRLIGVLNTALQSNPYVAGDYSIADIANWSWVRTYKWSGVGIEGLVNLRRWMDQMSARPACQKGVKVPFEIPNLAEEGEEKGAEEFAKGGRSLLTR